MFSGGDRPRRPVLVLWLLFSVFVLYGGTIPFDLDLNRTAILNRAHNVSLNPLIAPDTGRRLSIPDAVQNILLFLPFGALGFLGGARSDRTWDRFRRLAYVTGVGMLLSTTVEALQLLTADRVSSLGDVLCNTAGAAMGAGAAWQLRALAMAGLNRLRAAGLADVAELRPLSTSTLILLIAFWQPFDVTIDVSTIVGKVRSLHGDLWQFTGLRDEGTSIMLSAFFAMTFASYLSTLGERRSAIKTAMAGFGLVWLLESTQLFIGSRMPGAWDGMVASIGVVLGVIVWTAASRVIWSGLWLGVLWAMTFAAAALQMLSPFEWTSDYHSMGWFPFLGYYGHTTFETLSHVIELVLLYLPLGFFVGQTRNRIREAASLALGLTFVIAGPVEYLQGFVTGRYPDLTDIFVSLCGALLGAWAGGVGAARTPDPTEQGRPEGSVRRLAT